MEEYKFTGVDDNITREAIKALVDNGYKVDVVFWDDDDGMLIRVLRIHKKNDDNMFYIYPDESFVIASDVNGEKFIVLKYVNNKMRIRFKLQKKEYYVK